jgi:ketosteroid isomerase-like protein
MREKTWIAFLPLLAALAGASGCGEAKPPLPDTEDLKEQLLEADRQFALISAERGALGWAYSFAEDGIMMQGSKQIQGRAAIQEAMKPLLDDPLQGLTWTPETAWASQTGDLGVTTGDFRSFRRDQEGQEQTVASGGYITVWQRQEDGSWKVVLDGGSPDPPTAQE